MNVGKTLFAQIMTFVPWTSFGRIVQRSAGDAGVRPLTCAEQFRAMALAQMTWRESLRGHRDEPVGQCDEAVCDGLSVGGQTLDAGRERLPNRGVFHQRIYGGRIGRLGVIYNRFHSQSAQRVQTLTLLPISDLIDDLTTRATVIWPWELAFEDFLLSDKPEDMFETLATMIVRSAIAGCFLEAMTSEYLARVVSMRNASENADEMIGELSKEYNRARQGQITMELLDIITGVGAAQK